MSLTIPPAPCVLPPLRGVSNRGCLHQGASNETLAVEKGGWLLFHRAETPQAPGPGPPSNPGPPKACPRSPWTFVGVACAASRRSAEVLRGLDVGGRCGLGPNDRLRRVLWGIPASGRGPSLHIADAADPPWVLVSPPNSHRRRRLPDRPGRRRSLRGLRARAAHRRGSGRGGDGARPRPSRPAVLGAAALYARRRPWAARAEPAAAEDAEAAPPASPTARQELKGRTPPPTPASPRSTSSASGSPSGRAPQPLASRGARGSPRAPVSGWPALAPAPGSPRAVLSFTPAPGPGPRARGEPRRGPGGPWRRVSTCGVAWRVESSGEPGGFRAPAFHRR